MAVAAAAAADVVVVGPRSCAYLWVDPLSGLAAALAAVAP